MTNSKDYLAIQTQYCQNTPPSLDEVQTLIENDIEENESFFKIFGFVELKTFTSQKIIALKKTDTKSYMLLNMDLKKYGWEIESEYSKNIKLIPLSR